jgi:hypothetical protein
MERNLVYLWLSQPLYDNLKKDIQKHDEVFGGNIAARTNNMDYFRHMHRDYVMVHLKRDVIILPDKDQSPLEIQLAYIPKNEHYM